MLLEVIVFSVEDARVAAEGGADRLEVARDISQGGLTPPLPLVRAIAEATHVPLRVMVRGNGGYGTEPSELATLRSAAAELAALPVDGIVIGYAREGQPALDEVARVLDEAPSLHATFHRAFDVLDDPLAAIDAIGRVAQIDRILTSGGEGTPAERCRRLREYTSRAGGRLTILAGGGVDEAALQLFARERCVSEVHVGRIARKDGKQEAPVSLERVRRLRKMCDGG